MNVELPTFKALMSFVGLLRSFLVFKKRNIFGKSSKNRTRAKRVGISCATITLMTYGVSSRNRTYDP